jgi:hypothetical protein
MHLLTSLLETDIIKMSQPVSRSRKTKHLAIKQQQQHQQQHKYNPEQTNMSDLCLIEK